MSRALSAREVWSSVPLVRSILGSPQHRAEAFFMVPFRQLVISEPPLVGLVAAPSTGLPPCVQTPSIVPLPLTLAIYERASLPLLVGELPSSLSFLLVLALFCALLLLVQYVQSFFAFPFQHSTPTFVVHYSCNPLKLAKWILKN